MSDPPPLWWTFDDGIKALKAVEQLFYLNQERYLVGRHFGVRAAPQEPIDILKQLEELGLVEWRWVDPKANEYGASRLPFLTGTESPNAPVPTRPATETRARARAKIRRAQDKINEELEKTKREKG